MRNHLESVHLRNKNFICDLCPKVYRTRAAIFHHMQVHEKKKFECDLCSYKSNVKKGVVAHKRTHAEKQECEICKKKVTPLERHMIAHEPKVSCPLCQKTVHRREMKRHIRTHENHKCASCRVSFKSKGDLKK